MLPVPSLLPEAKRVGARRQPITHVDNDPTVHSTLIPRIGREIYADLVQGSSADNSGVPHTHIACMVAGDQVVLVVWVVLDAAEGNQQ